MKIKIISDSTCDLPSQLLSKYDISLIPLIVVKDNKEYRDAIDITAADIFRHVANGGALCTTAALNYGDYRDVFAQYADDYDGVLHISIGSGFSSCYQNASMASQEFDNVRVVDSNSLSTGQGMVVLEACRLAQTATDLDQLRDAVTAYTARVEISFLLDRLDYMAKGGRCSSATALGANLLHLKPCIEVKDGKMTVVKKYRGNYAKCLATYVKDRLDGRDDIVRDKLILTWTIVDDDCFKAVTDGIRDYGHFDEVIEAKAGCTVSCHCGPGTLGIIFVRK